MASTRVHFVLSKVAIPEPTQITVGPGSNPNVWCINRQLSNFIKKMVTTDPAKVTCKQCLRSLK